MVPSDVHAGTYRIRESGSPCYWERLKDFSGTLDSVLANDVSTDPEVVTILSTDAGFKSTSCGTWTSDLSAITTSQTSFGAGTYIVGTDMQPGTYKATNVGDTCYWARLAGFTGTVHDIIANDVGNPSPIATIAATDKGFTSKDCGTWQKSG
jgi:hypothetical protein